jgi:hypothetical protein
LSTPAGTEAGIRANSNAPEFDLDLNGVSVAKDRNSNQGVEFASPIVPSAGDNGNEFRCQNGRVNDDRWFLLRRVAGAGTKVRRVEKPADKNTYLVPMCDVNGLPFMLIMQLPGPVPTPEDWPKSVDALFTPTR